MALRKEDVFVVTKQVLVDAADSIREKTEDPDLIKISDFDDEIDSIPTGGSIEETIFLYSIDANQENIVESYEIPSTITKIAKFYRNLKIKNISGNGVAEIGDSFCYENPFVESVSLPNLTTVNSNCFRDCSKLKTLNIPNVRSFYNYLFRSLPELTELKLTNPTLSLFGNQNIRDNAKLAKVVIPYLSTVTDGTFVNLPVLENLSLPKDGGGQIKNGLQDCTSLKNLFLPGSTMWTISNSNAFTNTPLKALAQDAHIWVNDNLVDSYKAANNWSAMSTIITRISDYTGDFNYMEGVVTS